MSNSAQKLLLGTVLLVLIVIALTLGPWLVLLCINTLAAAGGSAFYIDFTLKTWAATLGLCIVFSGKSYNK